MCKYRLTWSNPETRLSGSFNNLTAEELHDGFERAWVNAGNEGEVIMSSVPKEVVEYAD